MLLKVLCTHFSSDIFAFFVYVIYRSANNTSIKNFDRERIGRRPDIAVDGEKCQGIQPNAVNLLIFTRGHQRNIRQ